MGTNLRCVYVGTGYSTADTEGYSQFSCCLFEPLTHKLTLLTVADEDQMGDDFVRVLPPLHL